MKEVTVLFNDALCTFCLLLYDIEEREREREREIDRERQRQRQRQRERERYTPTS